MLAFFFVYTSNAQTPGLGTWSTLNTRIQFNSNWNAFVEAQTRSQKYYYDFSYHELKGGIGYDIKKQLLVFLAMGQYVTYTPSGNFKTPVLAKEFRLWQQLLVSNYINRLKLEHRYRIEQRFFDTGYRNRFRYLINAIVPINKPGVEKNTFYTSLFMEIFLTDRAPHFERTRFFAGAGYRFTKLFTLQSGFLRQYDYQINKPGTGKTYFQTSLLFNIDEHKSKRENNPMQMD